MCRKYLSESIKILCESGEIKKEMWNGRTLFTITNYNEYQGGKQKPDEQKDDEPEVGNNVGAVYF